MIRRIFVPVLLTPLFALAIAPTVRSQAAPDISGFTVADVNHERAIEDQFRALPKPEHIREYNHTISADPHNAGSPNSKKVAEYILSKFKAFGLNASIEEFEALMPYPTERVLEMTAPDALHGAAEGAGQSPRIRTPATPDAAPDLTTPTRPTATSRRRSCTSTTASPTTTTRLAQARRGRQGHDRHRALRRRWRGIKPKVAYEHGAVGCLIYSDPNDDGYYRGRRVSRRARSARRTACSAAA